MIWRSLEGEGDRGYVRIVASPRNREPHCRNAVAFAFSGGSLDAAAARARARSAFVSESATTLQNHRILCALMNGIQLPTPDRDQSLCGMRRGSGFPSLASFAFAPVLA